MLILMVTINVVNLDFPWARGVNPLYQVGTCVSTQIVFRWGIVLEKVNIVDPSVA